MSVVFGRSGRNHTSVLWELAPGPQPGRLWAGTIPGGLFRSEDGGQSWELMRGLCAQRGIPVIVNMHDVELARRFAARIIGMSGGRVVFDGPATALTDEHLKQIYGGEGWLA